MMPLLAPMPQKLTLEDGNCLLAATGLMTINQRGLLFAAQRLRDALVAAGASWEIALTTHPSSQLALAASVGSMLTQSYTLTITPDQIILNGSDAVGVFYGVCTLVQLIRQYGTTLPCLSITDYPDIHRRGVMLDISRDRVPSMPTLLALIDRLASWKINELQLYIEHTFAYQAHRAVWEAASPITSEELLILRAYCEQRHIDLVPNLNTLGHMERWLKHADYNAMAETPDGFVADGGRRRPASTLNPRDPKALALVNGLLDELLPHFTSRYLNIGGDEPWELGQGASRDVWEAEPGRIYLDYLCAMHREATERGFTMQFWADIIVKYPALVAELPADAIAMIWGYEADEPREEEVQLIAASDLPTYMVPGTSSWNSLAGRTTNALGNLKNAARLALQYGSLGYLITDWGDNGHWQPLSASYLGFLYGASVSWGFEANQAMALPDALSAFAFDDSAGVMGRVAYDMGDLYTLLPYQLHNGTHLFYLLQLSDEALREEWQPDYDTPALHDALRLIDGRVDALLEQMERAQMADEDALVKAEYRQIGAMVHLATARVRQHFEEGAPIQAGQVAALMEQHRTNWLARHREGGLSDSLGRYFQVTGSE